MEKGKPNLIALDAPSYKGDFHAVDLNWEDSINTWIKQVKDLKGKIVGHSVGASVALLANLEGELYSPSPIFKETIHLLTGEMKEKLGDKLKEIESLSLDDVKVKPKIIYVGEKEPSLMKETAKIISERLGCKMEVLKGKDHGDVIDHSGIVSE